MIETLAKSVEKLSRKSDSEGPFNPDSKIDKKDSKDQKDFLREEYDPDSKIYINRDDNGDVYKVNGVVKPNSEFTINGYTYTTDNLGRTVKVEGRLHLKKHEGRRQIENDVPGRLEGDDRGHIIADELDGSNGKENLVPMSKALNRSGDYRNLEREWKKSLKDGKEVNVSIEPEYDGESKRPTSFYVSYTIDNESYEKNILNK